MKIDLLVIYVSDIVLSKEFYEAIFGVRFKEEKHGSGPVHFSVDFEGLLLEIYPKRKRLSSSIRLGFKVNNLSKAAEALVKIGKSYKWKGENLVFTDLDENTIELSDRVL